MSIKNWKTDIKIKLPRVHFIKSNTYDNVAGKIISDYLKISFWVAFFGWWKIYEFIKWAIQ